MVTCWSNTTVRSMLQPQPLPFSVAMLPFPPTAHTREHTRPSIKDQVLAEYTHLFRVFALHLGSLGDPRPESWTGIVTCRALQRQRVFTNGVLYKSAPKK